MAKLRGVYSDPISMTPAKASVKKWGKDAEAWNKKNGLTKSSGGKRKPVGRHKVTRNGKTFYRGKGPLSKEDSRMGQLTKMAGNKSDALNMLMEEEFSSHVRKGTYDADSNMLIYDGGEGETPTPSAYKRMLKDAKTDSKFLNKKGIKHSLSDGKSRDDIGLPYIQIHGIKPSKARVKKEDKNYSSPLEKKRSKVFKNRLGEHYV